tara:strand:- start:284 stop:460 length:177 start_codon:yes stop_codon:yes gene_type:complete
MDGREHAKLLKFLDLAKADKRATIERLEKTDSSNIQLIASHKGTMQEIDEMIRNLNKR